MNRLPTPFILLIALLPFSCKKNNASNTTSTSSGAYKITLVSGGGQSDTIGNPLKDYIYFKMTYRNDTVSYGFVKYEVYDCDNNIQSTQVPIGKNNGNDVLQVSYYWILNGTVGTQSLKAILIDSSGVPRDSVVVTATGIAPVKGWYHSGCLPETPSFVALALQPTGRILGFYNAQDYPYYSDDEGITWHRLTTFKGNYIINNIITTPANEIFIYAEATGVFYSADGGQNWEKRISGLPIDDSRRNLIYTKSGILFLQVNSGLFLSTDKGISWHIASNAPPIYLSAQSFSNGVLIGVANQNLFKSIDGGENWSDIWSSDGHGTATLFLDTNGDIYTGEPDGIYLSKDTGATWTKFYQSYPIGANAGTVSRITKQNGALYFYATEKNILMRTADGVNFEQQYFPLYDNNGRDSYSYILSANNHLVVSTEWYGLHYYLP